jgi:hypothetical protein
MLSRLLETGLRWHATSENGATRDGEPPRHSARSVVQLSLSAKSPTIAVVIHQEGTELRDGLELDRCNKVVGPSFSSTQAPVVPTHHCQEILNLSRLRNRCGTRGKHQNSHLLPVEAHDEPQNTWWGKLHSRGIHERNKGHQSSPSELISVALGRAYGRCGSLASFRNPLCVVRCALFR